MGSPSFINLQNQSAPHTFWIIMDDLWSGKPYRYLPEFLKCLEAYNIIPALVCLGSPHCIRIGDVILLNYTYQIGVLVLLLYPAHWLFLLDLTLTDYIASFYKNQPNSGEMNIYRQNLNQYSSLSYTFNTRHFLLFTSECINCIQEEQKINSSRKYFLVKIISWQRQLAVNRKWYAALADLEWKHDWWKDM